MMSRHLITEDSPTGPIFRWATANAHFTKFDASKAMNLVVHKFATRNGADTMYATVKSIDTNPVSITAWFWAPTSHDWDYLLNAKPAIEVLYQVMFTGDAKSMTLSLMTNDEEIDPKFMNTKGVMKVTMKDLPTAFTARFSVHHTDKAYPSVYLTIIENGKEAAGTLRFTLPRHLRNRIDELNNKICHITRSPDTRYGLKAFNPVVIDSQTAEKPAVDASRWYATSGTYQEVFDVVNLCRNDSSTVVIFTEDGTNKILQLEEFTKYYSQQQPWFTSIPEGGLLCSTASGIRNVVRMTLGGRLLLDDNTTIDKASATPLSAAVQQAYHSDLKE